jgi:radical SAM superfamily enzyme YgiQ (UPF0313 family)
MLLIFPPVAKPCEPPAGIAKLAGALNAHGVSCAVLDANLEGLLYLLQQPQNASDTWTRRAVKNISSNLVALREPQTYRSPDIYSRAVKDVNRVLAASARKYHAIVGLADYHHQQLSPLRSADLITAAEHPEKDPFYPWFSRQLPSILEGSVFSQKNKLSFRRASSTRTSRFIGVSLNYLSQALCAFALIGYIRREYPGIKIILGGGLVTSWLRGPAWRDPFSGLVDHFIAGPGEGALLELFGINREAQASATPDYTSLPFHEYLSPGPILPYSGSSGCYWNKCSFCPETAEDNPYVPVPIEKAVDDLLVLVEKTKPVLIHLLDNAISPALMGALRDRSPRVPWYGFARISKELTDLDHCRALKRSGCVMLKLGLESGDQDALDRMRKGIDLSTASMVLKTLHAAGIATYVYLLFGTPAETIREARKTLAFVVAHKDAITFLNLAVFNMPVCGQEAGEYENGRFYEGDLSLYTAFRHPRGWDRKSVRRFLDGEFKKHPAVSAILKKDPPIFTSNHAAFFCDSRGPGGSY